MGNKQPYNVPVPNTNKKTKDHVCETFSFGQCEMQGWRPYMVSPSLSRKIYVFLISKDQLLSSVYLTDMEVKLDLSRPQSGKVRCEIFP
jgi:hypothetical protein